MYRARINRRYKHVAALHHAALPFCDRYRYATLPPRPTSKAGGNRRTFFTRQNHQNIRVYNRINSFNCLQFYIILSKFCLVAKASIFVTYTFPFVVCVVSASNFVWKAFRIRIESELGLVSQFITLLNVFPVFIYSCIKLRASLQVYVPSAVSLLPTYKATSIILGYLSPCIFYFWTLRRFSSYREDWATD